MKFQELATALPFLAASVSAASGRHLKCDMMAFDPKPEGLRCGALASPTNLNHMISNPAVMRNIECAGACHRHKDCRSFTWERSQKLCRLFDATAKTMEVGESMDGRTRFWNRDCHTCRDRVFTLYVDSPETEYHGKQVMVKPTAKYYNAQFSHEEATTFNIYQDGTITPADGAGRNSFQSFTANSEDATANDDLSDIRFLTDDDAAASSSSRDVHCAITRDTMEFNCMSDIGDTFWGCRDKKNSASGLMLSGMMASDDSLHSKHCQPLKLMAKSL